MSAEIRGHRVAAGHPCPYSTASGCSIYEERPEDPCRNFICSWLVEGSPLPDWMRPDQCGAIVLLSMPWHGDHVVSAIPVGKSIPQKTLEWLKAYASKHRRPLIFYERIVEGDGYSGLKRFGFGPPEFRQRVARMSEQELNSAVTM